MMGIRLFVHSIRMVFENLGEALRIFGVLYLPFAAATLTSGLFLQGQDPLIVMFGDGWSISRIMASVAVLFISVALLIWMAIGWHRYVLCGERTTRLVPRLDRERFTAYLLRSVIVTFIMALLFACSMFIFFLLGFMFRNMPFVMTGAAFVLIFLIIVLVYRLSPILPAVAVDHPLSTGEALVATRHAKMAIAVLTIVSLIGSAILQATLFLVTALPVVAVLWAVTINWIGTVVGVAILTTIYGHYVEGRPLA
ncbi:hypothetical protein [Pararhizobium haloflavum]|uniref:hypothetical protein n=1 Tax=Pararhizobium haloflavum TaxID=2037914 RepID=UPI0012FFFFF4|nr:hypothetical protein [Pararhizobium haloflavum]